MIDLSEVINTFASCARQCDLEFEAMTNTMSTSSETASTVDSTLPSAPIARYGKVLIRPYVTEDAALIYPQANNPKIARYMRNRFPSPYSEQDAINWLSIATKREHQLNFAVCRTDGTYIGGIGFIPGSDIESRTWEVGYWLGEAFWGQGLATDAVVAFTRWAFETFPELGRIEAGIFDGNVGSTKVVEKSGFTFEGRRRRAVEKNGVVIDLLMYSLLREERMK